MRSAEGAENEAVLSIASAPFVPVPYESKMSPRPPVSNVVQKRCVVPGAHGDVGPASEPELLASLVDESPDEPDEPDEPSPPLAPSAPPDELDVPDDPLLRPPRSVSRLHPTRQASPPAASARGA